MGRKTRDPEKEDDSEWEDFREEVLFYLKIVAISAVVFAVCAVVVMIVVLIGGWGLWNHWSIVVNTDDTLTQIHFAITRSTEGLFNARSIAATRAAMDNGQGSDMITIPELLFRDIFKLTTMLEKMQPILEKSDVTLSHVLRFFDPLGTTTTIQAP